MKKLIITDSGWLIIFFLGWCVMDYVLVASPDFPDNIHDCDWIFILIPIVTLLNNLWFTRRLSGVRMMLYSLAGTVAVCLFFMLAVMTLGILFHFRIGGAL